MTGDNLIRYHKLGALVRALQLPRLILGDFNIPAKTLAKTDFISKIGGTIFTGDLVTTCTAGREGSLIDYATASHNCLPFLIALTPVVQVPWKTHIGFEIRIRCAGTQLLVRNLEVPAKLPQVCRPRMEAQPGSKSSESKKKH